MHRLLLTCVAVPSFLLTQFAAAPNIWAIDRHWDDGGTGPAWGSSFNWNPDGVPASTDDVFIGNLPTAIDDVVLLNFGPETVDSLTLTNGADLLLSGNRLLVDEFVSIGQGSGSTESALVVLPTFFDALVTGTILLGDGGRLVLQNGPSITVDGLGPLRGRINIDSGGTLTGFGIVKAGIDNNGTISAVGGGRLTLAPGVRDSDFDGDLDTGIIHASTSDITLQNLDNLTTQFRGRMDIDQDQEVFVDGFSLRHQPEARMTIDRGTYRFSGGDAHFRGTLNVPLGFSRIVNDALDTVVFRTDSTTNLDGVLSLQAETEVQAGASFSGFGRLTNEANIENSVIQRTHLNDGVIIDTLLSNEGNLSLGDLGTLSLATVRVDSFDQSEDGLLNMQAAGVAPDTHDRLVVANNATLGGRLSFRGIAGFTPVLGNSITIIETIFGNVGGTFDSTALSFAGDGLAYEVVYNPKSVVIQVVEAFTADFDDDGDVDSDDLAKWEDDFGGPGSDANFDGISNGADFLAWQRQLGLGVPLASSRSIPEPSCLLLLTLAATSSGFIHRYL